MDTSDFDMVMETARRWFARTSPLTERLLDVRRGHTEASVAWPDMAGMGWLAMPFSGAAGGYGATAAQLFELIALAGSDARPEPLALHLVVAPWLVRLRPEMVEALAQGHMRLAVAQANTFHATPDHTSIDAAAALVFGTPGATHVLLACPDGRCALVEAAGPDITLTPGRLLDGRRVQSMQWRGVQPDWLGESAQSMLDHAACALVADTEGVLHAAFEMTLDYLKTRIQFRTPLAAQQSIQHRMAEIYCDLQQLKSLCRRLANEMCDQQGCNSTLSDSSVLPIAKSFVGRRALRAAGQLIQLSGGIGVTDEYRLAHLYKRIHVNSALFGDSQTQLARISVASSLLPN